MIGGAVLLVGLLLILAGLASARIPGEATFASSGISLAPGTEGDGQGPLAMARRARNPIRAFVLSPIHPATWYANAAIGLGFFVGFFSFIALISFASAGFASLVAGIGVLFIVMGIEGSRLVARLERRRVTFGDPNRLIAHPYRPLRGSLADLIRAEFADESRWRDVLYVVVNFPLAVIEFFVVASLWTIALWLLTMPLWYDAVPGATLPGFLDWLSGHSAAAVVIRPLAGAALLPVAASVSQLVMALHRALVAGLLCTSESRELRRQVETLKESRSAVLDVEASELRRIERDLHDGAQQRLVMLTIDLGLASEKLDSDPAAARKLVLEGQEQARQALAELRDLVRGIAPSILLDRGLVPALSSIAGRGPVPTVVRSDLVDSERLPPAVERAAYFVVAEALANVAKHSRAEHCEVRCRRESSRLVVEVWDDGVGGAKVDPGGGLAGLAGRVAGVDGTFTVTTPSGGGTLVRAELPVATWAAPGPPEPTPVSYWR
ncbi:MAG TPA: sensor domain-containing protein [Candidatus Limnocylindrales bacterium]|nr:sensor domain-containing protein [Candidatus Limnocylindrales bacterium]